MDYLLDTCALVWAVADPDALSAPARAALAARDAAVYVSPLSCAELACLTDRGRIKLDRHWKLWFNHFTAANGWTAIDIDTAIVQEAYSLPGDFHQDPVDRILTATARLHDLVLVTADGRLRNYPHVRTLW